MKLARVLIPALVVLAMSASFARADRLGLLTESPDDEVILGVKYTSSHFMEFLWGLSRPLHLYNTQPDGTRIILPFWTRPMTDGGFLSWLNPEAWENNANLTAGALASEITIGVLIGSAASD